MIGEGRGMKRIIAVNSNCYHGYAIEEAVAGIRRAGFHYIELTATKGWTEHVFPDMPFERLLAIQDLLRRNELIPFSMSGHCNLMDPERIPDFEKNIRLAAFLAVSISFRRSAKRIWPIRLLRTTIRSREALRR